MTRRWRLIPRIVCMSARCGAVGECTAPDAVRKGRPALSAADGAGPAHWRMRSRIQTPASLSTPVPVQLEPLQVPVLKTAPERWSSE